MKRILLTFFLLSHAVVSVSATYFVDQNHPESSDTNPGTELLPWKTIQRSVRSNILVPGDIVLVKNGIYTELNSGSNNSQLLGIRIQAKGTPQNRITIKNYPDHHPIIDQKGNTYSVGFMNEGSQAAYITIEGFEIRNVGTGIFLIWGDPTGFIIRNNYIHHINGNAGDNVAGVNNWGGKDVIVENNIIHTISVNSDFHSVNAAGVLTYSAEDMIVANNEIYNTAIGVRIKRPAVTNLNGPVIKGNLLHDLDVGINYSEAGTGGSSHGDMYTSNNVIYKVNEGITLDAGNTALINKNLYIFNNTISAKSNGIFLMWVSNVQIYNNIILTGMYAVGAYTDKSCTKTVEFSYVNNNAYGNFDKFITDGWCTASERIYNSLSEWSLQTTYDKNSLIIDSNEFIDAVQDNYRLVTGSSLSTLGKSGESLGAYMPGIKVGPDRARPAKTTAIIN